jgi:hypothetical protein
VLCGAATTLAGRQRLRQRGPGCACRGAAPSERRQPTRPYLSLSRRGPYTAHPGSIGRARRDAEKRGGGGARAWTWWPHALAAQDGESVVHLALDEALQKLARLDGAKARIVELRLLLRGARGPTRWRAVLGVSPRTVAGDLGPWRRPSLHRRAPARRARVTDERYERVREVFLAAREL